jgi:hypothetical protein
VPTVRLSIMSGEGAALHDVDVTVDGKPLPRSQAARPLVVEPGVHVFRFERAGYAPAEVRAVIHTGERDHLVEAVLAAAAKEHTRKAPSHVPSHVPSYVLGGVGAVALVVAGALTLKGHLDRENLRSSCAPYCSPEQVRPIRTMWIAAGVLAGAGAAAVGAAIVLWSRTEHEVTLRVGPDAARIAWTLP